MFYIFLMNSKGVGISENILEIAALPVEIIFEITRYFNKISFYLG